MKYSTSLIRRGLLYGALLTAGWLPLNAQENPHGDPNLQCATCHTTAGWRDLRPDMTFDHAATRFPLAGRHAAVACVECHTNLQFAAAGRECIQCHLDVHRGQFAQNCADCHTPAGWDNQSEMYRRHELTRFPLTGVHAAPDCQACHATGDFAAASTECQSCHFDTYRSTSNPDHSAAGFPVDCGRCHRVTAANWSASFAHTPAFPLRGGHGGRECADCHAGQFAGTSPVCMGCHAADYQSAQNPVHTRAPFPESCSDCHTIDAWRPATFDHALARFALTGAHRTAECAQCHADGRFTGTPAACYDCHRPDYENVSDPNHVAGLFPQDCAQCHSTDAWQPAAFDHEQTDFPLTGAHVLLNCAQCHVDGRYAGTPTACYDCHRDDYEGVADPNHVAAQFPHECLQCHNTTDWDEVTFDHNQTDFPLTGAHVPLNCVQCHVDGRYAGTPTACYDCHRDDYEGVADPNHVAAQFPHECLQCHNTTDWDDVTFDHNQTGFPLTGAHVPLNCVQCHVDGRYAGTPTACYDCHRDDYEGVLDPNHVTAQFPHECLQCHNTTDWDDVTFDHNQTDFPLTGAHVPLNCLQCHIGGQYQGTPTDCYFCHAADYNGATDPNHQAAGFPLNCDACHTTFTWDAQFDHDALYFPIYSGRHRGEWDRCSDCHTNPNNYAVFSCIDCHEHNCPDMANEHDEVPGYVCESNACLECHPNGDGIPPLRRRPEPTPRIK